MSITAGDVVWNIVGDSAQLKNALEQSRRDVNGFTDLLLKNSDTIGMAFLGVGAAITGALGLAVKSATDFNAGMAEINSLGVENLGALEDAVKKVSTTFGTDLKDSVQATYDAISSGVSEMEAPYVLEQAAKAAVAGVSDLSTALELGTSVTNAFGGSFRDVNQVFDQAFIAVKAGVTTFGELGSSVGQLSPLFAAAGLKSEEMFASISALTLGGMKTGEAVTYLKSAISNVIKPSAEAAELADALGLQFDATSLRAQGLAGFMEQVKEKTGGNIETMGRLFGSTEALSAMLALTGQQADEFSDIMREMQSGVSATDAAFEKIKQNNPALAFKILNAELQVVKVEMGNELLPVVTGFAQQLTGLAQSVRGVSDTAPALFSMLVQGAGYFGILSIALGLALKLLQPFVTLWAGLSTTWMMLGGAGGTLALVLGGLEKAVLGLSFVLEGISGLLTGTVVGAFALAAAGVGAAVVAISSEWENVRKMFADFGGWLLDTLGGAWDGLVSLAQEAARNVQLAFTSPIDAILANWETLVNAIAGYFGWIAEQARAVAELVAGTVANLGVGPAAIFDYVGGMIPGFADGGVSRGGIVRVGENGPETMVVPPGTRVAPHEAGQGVGAAGGMVMNVTVNNPTFLDENAMRRFNEGLGSFLHQRLASQGAF